MANPATEIFTYAAIYPRIGPTAMPRISEIPYSLLIRMISVFVTSTKYACSIVLWPPDQNPHSNRPHTIIPIVTLGDSKKSPITYTTFPTNPRPALR
jgi:hypothetical protein